MATVRYTSHFRGAAGNEFLVRIYDLEYTHSPLGWGFSGSVPMTIKGDGLEIQYKGKTDTHLDPIIPSTCTLDLVITNDDQAKLLTNIEAGSEFQIALEILHKTTATTAGEWDPFWRGVLSPETVSTDIGIHPFGVSLTFTDGLALLKDAPYRASEHVPFEGGAKLRKHLGRALSYLPHIDLWDYTNGGDPFFVSLSDLYHKNHIVGSLSSNQVYTDDPLFYSGSDSAAFYDPSSRPNPYGRHFIEEGAYYSCYDVIRDIMVTMGLRMNHAYGRFFAVSPTVMATAQASAEYVVHGRKSDARSLLNPSFQDSVSQQLSTSDHSFRIGKEEFSDRYDIAVGSQESWLPAVHSATYVHRDAGVKGVFARKSAYYLDLECFPPPPPALRRPNNGFLGFSSGLVDADIPTNGLVNPDATVGEDTGLRIQGTLKVRLRNPRNGASSDVGTANNQVRVAEQWLGCKIVCDLTIKVGSYYLVQTVTQTSGSDFTDEADFGEITLNSTAPGVAGGTDRQYYPLEASTAQWTTTPGTFAFDMANFELTNPLIQGIEYDDENGEVTSYPVGCWTRRREHNNLRYDNQSYNHWTSDQPAEYEINIGENTISFSYPNPYMSIELDLQTPPLPDGVSEQTGVTFDVNLRGFTAEGDALPDDASADVAVGDDWLGNVLAGPAYIKDLQVFVGSGSDDIDTFYRVSEENPRGGEHFLAGRSILGARYRSANGAVGYLTHSNSDTPPTEGMGLGYKMITEGTVGNLRGNFEELAASAYQFRSKNRHLYNLRLIRKEGSPNHLIAPHTLFHYSYPNPDEDLLVLSSRHNLHREEIEITAVELTTEPRTITEATNSEDRGTPGIAGGGYPVDVLGGKLGFTQTGGVAPADVTKLGFLNTNSAGDGIDTIDGFTGGGGSVSADDQLKLDAITIDANGNITDFTVAGQPLTSDEIEDASSSHKFATAGQLTQIATNQSDISTNATNITGISNGLSDIQSFFKEENTGDGVGVYIDTTDTGKSHVSVTETAGKLQVGERTVVDMSETSPGTIAMKVQAGATGSEAQVTAIQISGNPTVNTKATVNITSGDFRVSSPTQFNQNVAFAGGSNTITFTAGTSGIDYNDLNNSPTVPTATSQLTNDSGFVTTDTNTNIGDTNLTLSADRTLTCSANDLTLNNPGSFIITNSAGATVFEVAPGSPSSVQVNGNFNVDSAQVTGGSIRLEEANLLGSNYIELKAPISITNNVTLTFPDGAGSNGQVLASNGSGTLSWTDRVSQTNPLIKGALSIGRITAGNTPKLYIKGEDDLAGVALQAPESISTDVTFTLPETDGTNGQAIVTDGAGALSFATISGGGSSAPIVLANISGRYMYSSTDSGERMWTGQGSYGPFNWYSFTSEPGTTMRTYSASDAVGTKTGLMNHWQLMAYGVHVPTTDKKVRVDFMMRMQNPPASSTWGFSLWGANRTTTGTASTSITTTLRGISSDVTAVDTNSTRLYHGSVETDADFTEDVVILMPENRTGTLTTTTYLLCNFQFTLID